MSGVTIKAYAKINLTLEILGRLPSGYHEIVSVMQQLALYDEVSIQDRSDGLIEIYCDVPEIPLDERNLVWQAAELLRRKLGLSRGANISIVKRIPIAGGLAGGSSDAAATLRGLNILWDLGLKDEELIALGQEIGMDVPFSILGGIALATGRGERVQSLPSLPCLYVVVANPGIRVSTREAFESIDSSHIPRSCQTTLMLAAILRRDVEEVINCLYNDFELNIAERIPASLRLKEIMLANGASNAILSGSGSSVYCLLTSAEQAESIARALEHEVPFVIVTTTRQIT